MKIVYIDGKPVEVPDDATLDEINEFFAPPPAPAAPDVQASALSRFVSGVADTTVRGLPEMAKAMLPNLPPMTPAAVEAQRQRVREGGILGAAREAAEQIPGGKMLTGILSNSANQLGQARDLYRQGDTAGAIGRVAAAVPIVGPLADQVTDTAITEGNLPRAAGQVTGILGSAYAPKIAGATKPILQRGAASLNKGAATRYEKILNPTTKGNKIRTAEAAPELAKRRFTARSMDDFTQKATEAKEAAGAAVGDAFDALPGDTAVPLDPILKTFAEKTVNKFTVRGADGAFTAPNPESAVALNKAGDIAKRLQAAAKTNPDGSMTLSVEALRKFKQGFDDIGRQAGRFEGRTLADQSSAAVQSIAADASRNALNTQFPEIAALNKEFGFWKDVERVALDTALRRKGQAPSLLTDIAKGAGTVAGGAHGGIEGALAGRAALGALSGARRNPFIQTQLAARQAAIADRIANFNPASVGILGPAALAQQGILAGR